MGTTFNTRIQLKYDTYTNWDTNNPTLLKGELAIVEVPIETGVAQNEPTYLLKVGDGVSDFKTLKWVSGTAADVYSWAKAAQKPTYNASEIEGLEAFIGEKIEDTDTQYQIVKNGDMGFKLQSKAKDGLEWADVNEITLTPPTYSLIEGDENGTVKFGITGSEQSVKVHGLGSAAYTEAGDYDAAGTGASEANKVKTELIGAGEDTSDLDTIKGAKKYADEKATAAQSAANGYTDSKISELNIGQYATTEAMTSAIGAAKTELIGDGSGSSTTIKGVYDEAKAYADQQIAAQISSTYKAAGSIEFASLPELNALIEGKVYNVTDAFTTNENFVEGTGKSYPAGTNVVCIDIGTDEFKWDVLAGMVDLSAYDTAEVAQGKIDIAKQAAIDAAATDATQKANTAEQNAKSYADGLKTTIDESIALKADQSAVDSLSGKVTTVESELAKKANDADLATVAKTGKIDDLTQTATIIFNCGSSSEVM